MADKTGKRGRPTTEKTPEEIQAAIKKQEDSFENTLNLLARKSIGLSYTESDVQKKYVEMVKTVKTEMESEKNNSTAKTQKARELKKTIAGLSLEELEKIAKFLSAANDSTTD